MSTVTTKPKRVIVATLGKAIGELEVDGTTYPLLAPNGYVVQELEAIGASVKLSDAYRIVGKCCPSLEEEVLLQLAADDIAGILEEIKDAILGTTREVVAADPKAGAATTS